jgi:hypothetical protein
VRAGYSIEPDSGTLIDIACDRRRTGVAMNVRKDLPALVILTAAFAAPASGQTAAPAVTSAAPNAASIPDFSGAWAHPGIGFGLPLSGPGPVRNKSRLRSGASNPDQLVGDYSNPILKPAAAEIVKKLGEISLSGRAFPDPDSQCLQNPVPYIFWNFYLRVLQQPDKVTLVYQHDDDFRQVRLDQPHPATVIPSVHGDSVGHYEGDTLVIDTVGIRVGPFFICHIDACSGGGACLRTTSRAGSRTGQRGRQSRFRINSRFIGRVGPQFLAF